MQSDVLEDTTVQVSVIEHPLSATLGHLIRLSNKETALFVLLAIFVLVGGHYFPNCVHQVLYAWLWGYLSQLYYVLRVTTVRRGLVLLIPPILLHTGLYLAQLVSFV